MAYSTNELVYMAGASGFANPAAAAAYYQQNGRWPDKSFTGQQAVQPTAPPSAGTGITDPANRQPTPDELRQIQQSIQAIAASETAKGFPTSLEEASQIFGGSMARKSDGAYITAPGTGLSSAIRDKPGLDWKTLDESVRSSQAREEQARQELGFQKGVSTGRVDGTNTLDSVKYANEILSNPQHAALSEMINSGYALGFQPGETVADYLNRSMSGPNAGAPGSGTPTTPVSPSPVIPTPGSITAPPSGTRPPGSFSRSGTEAPFAQLKRQIDAARPTGGMIGVDSETGLLSDAAIAAGGESLNRNSKSGNYDDGGKVKLMPGASGLGGMATPTQSNPMSGLTGLARARDAWKAAGGDEAEYWSTIQQVSRLADTLGKTMKDETESWAPRSKKLQKRVAVNKRYEGVGTAFGLDTKSRGVNKVKDDYQSFLDQIEELRKMGMSPTDAIALLANKFKPQMQQSGLWTQRPKDPVTGQELAEGGGAIIGGEPHFIVDSHGVPKAALTEDGKDEAVMGAQDGVEVIPLDPARRAAYEAKKARSGQPNSTAGIGDLPRLKAGGFVRKGNSRTAPSRRPGASSKNNNKTMSGNRSKLPDGSSARRTPTVADGRADNGQNQGRSEDAYRSRAQSQSMNTTDDDAASIRPPVKNVQKQVIQRWNTPVSKPRITPGAAYAAPLMPRLDARTPQNNITTADGRVVGNLPGGAYGTPGGANFKDLLNFAGSYQPKPPMGVPYSPKPPMAAPIGVEPPMVSPIVRTPVVPGFQFGGMTGTGEDLDTTGWGDAWWGSRDQNAYADDNAGRWSWLAAGRPTVPVAPTRPTVATRATSAMPIVGTRPPSPRPGGGTGVFVGSGGPRTIGNNVVGARFGFDVNAPSAIAGANQRMAVGNNPGVGVMAAHKITPETLRKMTPTQRAMFESQIRATGQDPETYFAQAEYAEPGSTNTGRSFI